MSTSPPRPTRGTGSTPSAPLAPATPRATPARRAKTSSGSNADELARAEVLELTLFAEKKEWIEDKIKFLSTLPPIEVISPDPPLPSHASRAELDTWWAEHDRIETEVDEFDLGDLARMRQFARDKSKQALSPRDTDLIEITLTTLFAVDRLLHLLRQRRKALTLLGYRLQWEEAVAAAWNAQRQILADLPTFLDNATWSPSASLSTSRSRQLTTDDASLAPSPSLPSLSSSRSLSLLASSTSSSSTSLRSSTRTNLLTLQLSSLSTLSHSLLTSLLPLSATHLDKLIDSSPQPLPESFLDEQDRLEAECNRAAQDLPAFLDDVRSLRDEADKLAGETAAVLAHGVTDTEDGEAAFSPLRDEAFPSLHAALARLPDPSHPLAPAQRASNATARDTLARLVHAAEEAVERGEARARARECAREVGERVRAVRARVEELDVRLKGACEKGPEGAVDSSTLSPEEQDHERACAALVTQLRASLADADAVQPEAARAVVAGREAGLPREVLRAVRDAAVGLGAVVREVEGRVRAEERRREERVVAREVLRAVEEASVLGREAVRRLGEEARRARWSAERVVSSPAEGGGASVLDAVRSAQDAILAPVLARADALVQQGRALPLARSAADLVRTLRGDAAAELEPLERLRDAVQAQAAAVKELAGELPAVEGDLTRLGEEVQLLLDADKGADDPLSPLEERLADCAAALASLTSSAHARIPLLESTSPARQLDGSAAPFDLAAQDAAVRAYVNERCARASGLVDEVRARVGEVEHLRDSRRWDEEAERVDGEVRDVEVELLDATDEAGAALLSRLGTLSTSTLPALHSTLSRLAASTTRSVVVHAARQTRFEDLTKRVSAAHAAIHAAQAERQSQRDALLAAVAAQSEALKGIERDAEGLRAEARSTTEALAVDQDAFLRSPDLDEGTKHDIVSLERAKRSAVALRERLDESTASLEALEEQASGATADRELDSAVWAARHATSAARAAVQSSVAALKSVRDAASDCSVARDHELQRTQREWAATAAVSVPAQTPPPLASPTADEPPAELLLARSLDAHDQRHGSPSADEADAAIIVQPSTPSPPPTLRRSLGSLGPLPNSDEVDDPFGPAPSAHDPFALPSGFDEPFAVAELRHRMQRVTAHEWLDASTVLQLPSIADADEVARLVADCHDDLDKIARLPHEQLLWTDVDALKVEQQGKEAAAARVSALARFGDKVNFADAALSDLLVAVDAATPNLPSISPEPGTAPALSLSDALVAASEAVTAVRVAAIPVVDDARVARAIERIEEMWAEMLSLVEDVRPRAGSAASSTSGSSLRLSARSSRLSVAPRTPSQQSSQSLASSTSTRSSSRASSDAALRSPRPSSGASSSHRESSGSFNAPQTPRAVKAREVDPSATPTSDRRGKSGLPVATPRRAFSPVTKPTPTAARPFSFDTPNRRDLSQSTSSIPRRSLAASTRRDSSASSASTISSLFSPKPQFRPSTTSSSRSARRESTASTKTTGRASLASSRSSLASSVRAPRLSGASTTPPSGRGDKSQPYRPDMRNKLDREVGSIINALPRHVQVPIQMADGKWTDESGVYSIGGRLYFCRILRSKQVMVRVGGGWLNLLQFLITHFGSKTVDGLTISPSTSLSKDLGSSRPQWINADSVRNQKSRSTSGTSMRDILASSVSSASISDLNSSASAMPLRRSLSGHIEIIPSPRRSRIGGDGLATPTPPVGTVSSTRAATPRAPKTPRPPVPIWRP